MDEQGRKPIRVAALEAMKIENGHTYKDGKYVECPIDHFDIVKCHYCEATGKTYTHTLTDYHRSEYRTDVNECARCKGTGRLKVKTTFWVEPFS